MSANITLNDNDLIFALKTKVESERLLAVEILNLLQQVQDRMLHLKIGYSSLFAFCVQELKYSESTAYRRISALRLSADVPKLKEQLQSGELTFQAVAQVQSFLNQEKKQNRKTYSAAEKKTLVEQVTSKTTRQVEQLLAELRSRYSHKNPNPSLTELMEIMADEILQQEEARQQRAQKRFAAKTTTNSTDTPLSESATLSISAPGPQSQKLLSDEEQHNAFSADGNLRYETDTHH